MKENNYVSKYLILVILLFIGILPGCSGETPPPADKGKPSPSSSSPAITKSVSPPITEKAANNEKLNMGTENKVENGANKDILDNGRELEEFKRKFEAWKSENSKKYNKKLSKLNDEVKKNPKNTDILYKRGKFCYDNNHFEEAIADFASVLNMNKNHIEAIHYRAVSYAKTDRNEKAMQETAKLLLLNKKYVNSRILLGNCYLDSGQIDKAINEYETVKKLSKGNNDILFYYYINMSDIYRKKGDIQKAISLCKSSIETKIDLAKSYEFLAILYMESGKYEDAKKAIDKAIEQDPFRIGIYFYEGKYYIVKKDYRKALLSFDKAIMIDPSQFAPYTFKIDILISMKKPDRVIEAIEEAMKIDSKNPGLYYYRGIANRDLGNIQEAVKDLETSIRFSTKKEDKYGATLSKKELDKIKKQNSSLRNSPTPPLLPSNTAFAVFSSDGMNKLGEKYFSLLKQEKYKEITDLFHYPLEDTPKETKKDREMLIEFHKLMKREFGSVKNHTLFTMGTYSYHIVGIYPGKASYWQRNPLFKQLTYNVDFDKEGSGGIILQFCSINNKLEIRSVQFGLSQTNEGAKEKNDRVLKELERMEKEPDR